MEKTPSPESKPGSSACPICGNAVKPASRDLPFCSKRCRLADLGRWMDERYRISREMSSDDELQD